MIDLLPDTPTLTLGECYDALAYLVGRYGRNTPCALIVSPEALAPIRALADGHVVDDRTHTRTRYVAFVGPEIARQGGRELFREELTVPPQDLHTPETRLVALNVGKDAE